MTVRPRDLAKAKNWSLPSASPGARLQNTKPILAWIAAVCYGFLDGGEEGAGPGAAARGEPAEVEHRAEGVGD